MYISIDLSCIVESIVNRYFYSIAYSTLSNVTKTSLFNYSLPLGGVRLL